MPGGDAVPAAGVAFGTGLSGMDQALHLFQRQTASQGHGRAGGAGISHAPGGAAQCVGGHAESGASPREIIEYASLLLCICLALNQGRAILCWLNQGFASTVAGA